MWFNLTWGSVRRDVIEINVCLQETFLHQFDWLALSGHFILQFEITSLFFLEIGSTSRHVLFMLAETVPKRLFTVFIKDGGLCFEDELFSLLSFCFLLYLANLGVGVINRIDPHF